MTPKAADVDVPEGYKKVTQAGFYPFFALGEVGLSLEGKVLEVRQVTRTETVVIKGKKQEIEKVKTYFDLELLKEASGDDGSKAHKKVEHQAGTRITLSGGGNLVKAFSDAAWERMGNDADSYPTDGSEPKIEWDVLRNAKVFIRREKDGVMGKKSAYPGNKVTKYTVAFQY